MLKNSYFWEKEVKKMKKKSINPIYHIMYWIFVILILTLIFGRSWGNNTAAFFFISMQLPVVLGTSYFFNFVLVPRFFILKRFFKFVLYTVYTIIISLWLEFVVLMFSFIYLGNFSFTKLDPNASDTVLLALVLYLLVFMGSFLLLLRQLKENREMIEVLKTEKEKLKKASLNIMSNRRMTKIPYDDIVYIESLSDYIKVNTLNDAVMSREKISKIDSMLPDTFLRIHRSFIVNTEKIKQYTYNEVVLETVSLTIGRTYRQSVKERLKK